MILSFVKANFKNSLWRNIIVIISFMISIALIITLFNVAIQVENSFIVNASKFDLVITEKGSSTQAVLSSIYFYDDPIGIIPYKELVKYKNNENILKAVPIAMGDRLSGHKIIGTSLDYFDDSFNLAQGKMFENNFEIVLGATTAKAINAKIGDQLSSEHGLADSVLEHNHNEVKYTVTGILKKTNSQNDICAFTTAESIYLMHQHEDEHDDESEHEDEHEDEHEEIENTVDADFGLTAILIKCSTYASQAQLAIEINNEGTYLASNVNSVLREIYSLFDSVVSIVKIIIAIVIIMSLAMMFLSMYSAINERKKELAILRAIGTNRKSIFQIVLTEAFLISVLGAVFGYLLSRILLLISSVIISNLMGNQLNIITMYMEEFLSLTIAIFLGMVASIIPAIKVYKLEPTQYLR